MNKLPLLLLCILLGACGVLRAQSFDLTTGRVPVASLDGLWRFRTGDNPAWADPKFDDSGWLLLRSDKSWDSQGYKGYSGLAWYRFQVTVPADLDHVSLSLPPIYTCYEVYADGRLIGTYGKMPPNTMPYKGGPYTQVYTLQDGKHQGKKIEIALRVWQWPGWVVYHGGGPQSGGGLVGDTGQIQSEHESDGAWYFVDGAATGILGLLETLAGLGALALFVLRRNEREYLWFSLMMLSSATYQWLGVYGLYEIWNVEIRDLVNQTALAGIALASIAFYRALLQPKPTLLLKLAIALVALNLLDTLVASVSGSIQGVWFELLVGSMSDLVVNVWIITVVLTGARRKSPDARLLMAPVALITSLTLFSDSVAFTSTLGWQHRFQYAFMVTSKPFPIADRQVAEALFLLALFAILILRFTRTRSQEERFAGEVQAAREIQEYLIPVHMPFTPGLTIESEYRPAREVGGDFFQVLPHAENGSVLLVLGDIAGKGLHAGMLAALIVGAIRTAAKFTTDPEKVLGLLNERLQGRGLVTCLALLIERDGNVTLANAGHLPPYLNEREMPMDGALPLGAIPGVEFSVMHFQLAEGDSLMLMSDGVAEAQDARGRLFGFDRIGEMMIGRATAASLAIAAQNFGQEDDITVLTVARLAPAMIG
jgi:serine phosphatase RsbU (regulator of sigma subunit)